MLCFHLCNNKSKTEAEERLNRQGFNHLVVVILGAMDKTEFNRGTNK